MITKSLFFRASTAVLTLLANCSAAITCLPASSAASLGKGLVLDMDTADSHGFKHLDGATDIESPAKTGVGVANNRYANRGATLPAFLTISEAVVRPRSGYPRSLASFPNPLMYVIGNPAFSIISADMTS